MSLDRNNAGIFIERAVRVPSFRMNYEHMHSYVEFFYLKTGSCTYYVNGKEFHLSPGDIFIAAPGESHCTKYEGTVLCERTVIYCDLPVLGNEYLTSHTDLIDKLGSSGKILVVKKGLEQIDNLIEMMLTENNIPDDYSVENLILLFKQILLWIQRYGIFIYEQVDMGKGFDEDIESTMRLVAEEYAGSITLEDAAARINLSPTYLSKKFRHVTGKTFSEYVNYIRLRQATQMLLTTDDSVTDIATACGFNSSNYFKDCFKKRFGVSPRTYRTQAKTHNFEQ
ncbi:MAG: helix-turn-helix domain-containing protein [Lachnospiraceae bacterium]|nr:helix-turn-helix domain-containing protein [Lachnospiraceae bacterium]